jgi:stearoyl-CoA desaturase (delta-9 desaturase)
VKRKNDNVVAFLIVHAIAALALVPWFFSWTGVVLLLAGIYVFGMLGINLCFHRLLTHRGPACPLWLERTLVLLGVCSMQDSPVHWVAVHRRTTHSPTRRSTRTARSRASSGRTWAGC